jgi:glucan phosphoethanolaminetransferase (alkaline phosphatase superfamily)
MEQYNTTIQRANCLLPVSAQTENTETALYYVSLVLISIFVLEIFTAFYAFGWRRYTKFLFALDAFIVISSFIMEVYFHFGSLSKVQGASAGIVVLRLWKIIRAIHAVAHAVTLRNHLIVEEIEHARQIVNEEKVKAEQIIEEQQKKIDSLMELLGKSNKQGSPEQQNDGSVRKRSNTMDVIIRL